MKWKPVAASLIVIALALGGMALWRALSNDTPRQNGNTPGNAPVQPANGEVEGPTRVRVKLEDLPSRDPIDLWPQDGMRMSSPTFWTMWKTRAHVACRVIARGASGPWFEVGHTLANTHYMQVDLAQYGDEVKFCVEWSHEGAKYRSHERRVTFGAGACFNQRRYAFNVPPEKQPEFRLLVQGRDVTQLGTEPFMTAFFPEQVVPAAYVHGGEKSVVFMIQDGATVPLEGCFGFLEIYDSASVTYDRVLIELDRAP
jgi:hypothetical protein